MKSILESNGITLIKDITKECTIGKDRYVYYKNYRCFLIAGSFFKKKDGIIFIYSELDKRYLIYAEIYCEGINSYDQVPIASFRSKANALKWLEDPVDLSMIVPQYLEPGESLYSPESAGKMEKMFYDKYGRDFKDQEEDDLMYENFLYNDLYWSKRASVTKQNRNETCNCGSGKKFKKCCGR